MPSHPEEGGERVTKPPNIAFESNTPEGEYWDDCVLDDTGITVREAREKDLHWSAKAKAAMPKVKASPDDLLAYNHHRMKLKMDAALAATIRQVAQPIHTMTRWQRFRAWLGRRFRRGRPLPCPTSPYPLAVRDMHRYPVGVADLYYTNHPYRARLDNWLDLHRESAGRLAYATAALLGLALAVWLEGQGVVG